MVKTGIGRLTLISTLFCAVAYGLGNVIFRLKGLLVRIQVVDSSFLETPLSTILICLLLYLVLILVFNSFMRPFSVLTILFLSHILMGVVFLSEAYSAFNFF